jgi:hypothetical protein
MRDPGPCARIAGLATGLWLTAAPDLLGYGGSARVSGWVVGPLAASLSTIAFWQATRFSRWGNLPAGAWLVLSTLLVRHEAPALASDALSGVLLIASCFARGKDRHQMGGGWRSLWSAPGAPPPGRSDSHAGLE